MEILKIGYCGDDCNYCPRYLATQSGNEERLKEVAAMWRMIGWRDSLEPAEKLTCHGCASMKTCGLGIKECAIEKGVENCGQCSEYPCRKLLRIFKNNAREAIFCKDRLSTEDYQLFQRAFFSKKERLDRINREFLASF
jgi:hypothetical protein